MWCVIPSASRRGYHTASRGRAQRSRPTVTSRAAPGTPRGRALPGRGDDARAPASGRSKPERTAFGRPSRHSTRWHERARHVGMTRPGCKPPELGSRVGTGALKVDGMPREPRCGLAEQTRSEPSARRRHAPRRTGRNTQVKRHTTTPAVSSRESASAFTPKCSCPRRAAGLRDGRVCGGVAAQGVAAGCGIPSTSRRATTRRPGGRAARGRVTTRRGLPPGRRVVGLCQVDGMPHEPRRGRESTGRPARAQLISRPR